MNKYIKLLVLTIISVLISFSFIKLYTEYSEYKFLSNLREESYAFRFDYTLSEQLDEQENLENLNNYLTEYDLVLYRYEYVNTPRLSYYSTNTLSDFASEIANYQQDCKYKCIEINEIQSSDLNVSMTFSIYGSNKEALEQMEINIPNLINISKINDQDVNLQSDIEFIITEYRIYFVIELLLIFSLIFILYLDFLKTIDRVILHATYGYDFSSYIKYFYKNYVLSSYLYVIISSMICTLIFQRSLQSLILITVLHAFTLVLISIIILIITMFVYRNIKRSTKYNVVNLSITFISMITTVFIILATSLLSTFARNAIYYNNTSTADKLLGDYYSVHFNQNIDMNTQFILGGELLDNYDAYTVTYIEKDLEAQLPNSLLYVGQNFLKNNQQIKHLDGTDIIIDNYSKVYVLVANKELDLSFYNDSDLFEIIYVTDNNNKYNTFNPLIPYTTLDNTIIEVVFNPPLVSNVFLKASNKEEAIEIFETVYAKYGVDEQIEVSSAQVSSVNDSANVKFTSSLIASILSILSLGLISTFYVMLIFTKYKRKIVLAHIYGYNYLKVFSHLFKEIIVVVILAVMVIIFIFDVSKCEYLILLSLFVIMILIMYAKFRSLLKSSTINFIKGEM